MPIAPLVEVKILVQFVALRIKKSNVMKEQQVISSHHIECLPAVVGKAPKILILGTIPGDKSLELRKYYQDKSSLFWEMIETVLNGGNALSDYHSQISCLFRNHIALWDIIKSCDRKGSSDRNIRNPNYNEIEDFLCKHPTIRLIILKGGKIKKKV